VLLDLRDGAVTEPREVVRDLPGVVERRLFELRHDLLDLVGDVRLLGDDPRSSGKDHHHGEDGPKDGTRGFQHGQRLFFMPGSRKRPF
jgi:hypothetical protein